MQGTVRAAWRHAAARALALVLAVALALGLAPATALADDSATDDEATYTLTVVAGGAWDYSTYEYSYTVLTNTTYTLSQVLAATGKTDASELTMLDLLDTAVAAGDLSSYDGYESSYGYYVSAVDGVSEEYSDDYSTMLYWSIYVDGSYGSYSIDATSLEDGSCYQLALDCYSSVSTPDWSTFYDTYTVTEATDATEGETTYTLTVVAGTSTDWTTYETTYTVLLNKQYSQSAVLTAAEKTDASELTMLDLLAAAVAAGDLTSYDGYESSYGYYVTSVAGVAEWYSSDYSTMLYWSLYDNGSYGWYSIDATTLTSGGTYQLAYELYTTVAVPDWSTFYDTYAAVDSGYEVESDDDDTDSDTAVEAPDADEYEADAVSSDTLGDLFATIAASYADSTDSWQVMELAAAGLLTEDQAAAALEAALTEMQTTSGTTVYQRNIIALTAAGYDCTALPDGDGTYDAVSAMAESVTVLSPINTLIWTLVAYDSGDYEVPSTANLDRDDLIEAILAAQLADGGWAYSGSTGDVDMTAMAVAALAPYYLAGDEDVVSAVNAALVFLRAAQNADGGFGTAAGEETNADSTAMVIVALCALGIDPAEQWAAESGETPMSALLALATDELDGFTYGGEANALATEQGFRALVAYQGLVNTGSAYDIYLRAVYGEAGQASTASGDTSTTTSTSSTSDTTSDSTSDSTSDVPATGDAGTEGAVVLALVGVAGVTAAVALERRRRAA